MRQALTQARLQETAKVPGSNPGRPTIMFKSRVKEVYQSARPYWLKYWRAELRHMCLEFAILREAAPIGVGRLRMDPVLVHCLDLCL
jgi:hypothetical protein